MTRLGRLAAAAVGLLTISCLLRQVEAPRPLRPPTIECRPALQLDGRLVCGEPSFAALRALCPEAELADGDAVVTLADGCRPGRMPGSELLALGVKIDVNSASAGELEALPGIGPTLARRIVEARPYRSVADLDRVPGIGVARLAGMREHVRFTPGAGQQVAP